MRPYTVFDIGRAEDADLCYPVSSEGFAALSDLLRPKRAIAHWTPLTMEIINRDDDGTRWIAADAPWYGHHALILRSKAVLALSGFLKPYGQLLPLACRDAKVALFNVTRVIAALDEDASEVVRFPDESIMAIRRHVFRSEVVRGVDVFKLATRGGSIYVGQRFVDLWNAHGLTGLTFKPLWTCD